MAQIILTAEQQSLLASEDAPVVIVDDRGVPTHVAMPIDEARRVFDQYIRRALDAAVSEAPQLPLEPWDIKATIAEARQRHGSS